jgi:hypothetical protein
VRLVCRNCGHHVLEHLWITSEAGTLYNYDCDGGNCSCSDFLPVDDAGTLHLIHLIPTEEVLNEMVHQIVVANAHAGEGIARPMYRGAETLKKEVLKRWGKQ